MEKKYSRPLDRMNKALIFFSERRKASKQTCEWNVRYFDVVIATPRTC